MQDNTKPSKHWTKRAIAFFDWAISHYDFRAEELELLHNACLCLSTIDRCEAAIAEQGVTMQVRDGVVKANPATRIAGEMQTALLRNLKALKLEPPPSYNALAHQRTDKMKVHHG